MGVLYTPTNLYPGATFPEQGVIDVSVSNTFQCDIYGTTQLCAYRLKIYRNDIVGVYTINNNEVVDTSLMYDSGIVDLRDNPVYVIDKDGAPIPFEVVVPVTSLITNGINYKWNIEVFWYYNPNISSENLSIISMDSFFCARKPPSIGITNALNTITNREYTFYGTYSQDNGSTINELYWELTNLNSNKLVDTSAHLSGGAAISYTYSKFLDGNSYSLRMVVYTSDNKTYYSSYYYFNVAYDKFTIPSGIVSTIDCDKSAISCVLDIDSSITGKLDNSDYSFRNVELCGTALYPAITLYPSLVLFPSGDSKVLDIYSNNSLSFYRPDNQEMSYPASSYFAFVAKIVGNNFEIFSGAGIDEESLSSYTISLEIQNGIFIYTVNNIIIGTVNKSNVNDNYFLFILSNSSINIYDLT